jgi:phosphatidylinositol 4-kinase type 2
VPYTDVVYLSSKSFHYPYWDRRKFQKKKRALPEKPGSFQVFLKGFKDANVFLREHPWPDQYWSGFRAGDANGRRKKRKWTENCRPSSAASMDGGDYSDGEQSGHDEAPQGPPQFVWTESLKEAFREELEKLVILDYIMRNTDRGLDNWMVKVDWDSGKVSIASDPVRLNMDTGDEPDEDLGPRPVDPSRAASPSMRAPNPYKSQKPMNASHRKPAANQPIMSLGAIDNSLSWPWKHPDAWRR